MMISFWWPLVVIALLAGLSVVIPALRAKNTPNEERQALNTRIFQQRLKDLQADNEEGRLDDADFAQLSQELQRNYLRDTLSDTQPHSAEPKDDADTAKHRVWLWFVLLFVPISALLAYGLLGYQNNAEQWLSTQNRVAPLIDKLLADQLTPEAMQSVAPDDLLLTLQSYAQRQPDNAKAWFLLGSAYGQMAKTSGPQQNVMLDNARLALRRAYTLEPSENNYAIRYLQSLLAQNGGVYTPESRGIMQQLLDGKIEYPASLMMHGMTSFRSGEYAQAIAAWQTLLALEPKRPGHEQAEAVIQRSIEEARQRLAANSDQPPLEKTSLKVTVALASAVTEGNAADIQAGFLMVYARSVEGPPMPLAIKKLPLPVQFPYSLTLSDQDAMLANRTLSQFPQVTLVARLSKSGTAQAQPGDWYGELPKVASDATKTLQIVIEQQVTN